MIEVVNVFKSYKSGSRLVEALRGVSCRIERGRCAFIVGPSGSGKSTLLYLLGAVDRPSSGEIVVDGQDLTSIPEAAQNLYRRDRVGFIFQSFNLISNLTALENVTVPFMPRGLTLELRRRAVDLLTQVGLGDRLDHRPYQLSGGEQQRVAIARALVKQPILVLAPRHVSDHIGRGHPRPPVHHARRSGSRDPGRPARSWERPREPERLPGVCVSLRRLQGRRRAMDLQKANRCDCGPAGATRSERQHDLAEDLIRLQPRLRGAGLVEREGLIDDRAHQPPLEPRNDLAGKPPRGGDLLLEGPRPECRADHRDSLAQHQADVEHRTGSAEQADQDQPALVGDRGLVACQGPRAEQVDDHIHPAAAGECAHDVAKIIGGRVDAMIETEVSGTRELIGGARGAEDLTAHRVGDLNGCRADTTADGMHEHTFARRQAALRQQGIVRRDERLGDRGGSREIDVGRDQYGQPFVSQHVLGLSPSRDDAHDPVAEFERTDRVGPACIDDSGVFQAWYVGRRPGWGGIDSAALHEVGSIECARPHPHPHLIALRDRNGHLANFEDFGTADCGDHDSFHSCAPDRGHERTAHERRFRSLVDIEVVGCSLYTPRRLEIEVVGCSLSTPRRFEIEVVGCSLSTPPNPPFARGGKPGTRRSPKPMPALAQPLNSPAVAGCAIVCVSGSAR
jgi:ABC-type lipoprotein export system ATPase subunit